ncbi:MAG: inositol monophosphatase [Saprospirales bacterium]|nr:inositol monophosphatase [Saprospirales bacterium]MBK8920686.1 inositol monophosphatase [Saprospirales bacterium]
MPQHDLKQLTRQANLAVLEVAVFLREEASRVQPGQVEEKHLNGLVSYVDRTAEQMLVERLQRLLPEAAFITEEETVEQGRTASLQWIIDPLDGTTNYLYGLPHYSISVGLRESNEMLAGIVLHVPNNELFFAWRGGGAWCNDRPIRVSRRQTLRQALVATGFPYHNFSRADAWMKVLRTFLAEGRAVRRYGSAALDLAYVACGRFDIFFEYGLNAWDVAGGALLVHEAGGRVSDFSGGHGHIDGGEILACSDGVFDEALAIVQEAFVNGHPA